MSAPHPLIAAALAAPHTYAVVTTFADGTSRRFACRSAASAETHACCERRKIGRKLISRETGMPIHVISVNVIKI